jgi:hypothetical protein
MRLKPRPPGRSRTRHLIIELVVCSGAASGVSKFALGDLLGVGPTSQLIAWFVSFTIFFVADRIDVTDAPATIDDEH